MSYDAAEDTCSIKYVDYGGYDVIPTDQLKQIRTDFLSLPFQVCGNISGLVGGAAGFFVFSH